MNLTNPQLFELFHFTQRPGMYIGNSEIKSIEAFLIGYDFNRRGETGIQRALIQFIFQKYNHIPTLAEQEKGNVHFLQMQLPIVSKETGKTEFEIFREESMNFLIEISDKNGTSQFLNLMKSKLIEALQKDLISINQPVESSLTLSPIESFAKQLQEWKGKKFDNATMDQLEKLAQLHRERQMQWMHNHDLSEIKESLLRASKTLLQLLS